MDFSMSKRRRDSTENCESAKRTIRKLDFSVDGSSPALQPKKLSFLNIDENSCGSAFSDNSDESSILDSTASDVFSSPMFQSQPARRLSNFQNNEPSLRSVKHLKEKSKSDSFFQNTQQIIRALEFSAEHSMTHNSHEDRLVGDLSRKHVLPILQQSKHRDLASISPRTLVDLIDGRYQHEISEFAILDARYPYEFNGGHINGAENAYVKDKLFEKLFEGATISSRPKVLVIHCEFSSERGPKLMREIRERDRMLNKHAYPNLFYPEMYLLEGGYKQFYEEFSNYCSPEGYLPMLHDNHRNELKYFRKKSKTWETETRKRATAVKLTKLSF